MTGYSFFRGMIYFLHVHRIVSCSIRIDLYTEIPLKFSQKEPAHENADWFPMLFVHSDDHLLHPAIILHADHLLSEKLPIEVIEPDSLRYIPFRV